MTKQKRRVRGPTNYTVEFKIDLILQWSNYQRTARDIEAEDGIAISLLSRWKAELVRQGYLVETGMKNGVMQVKRAQLPENEAAQKVTAVQASPTLSTAARDEISKLKDRLIDLMSENSMLKTRIIELEGVLSQSSTTSGSVRRKN